MRMGQRKWGELKGQLCVWSSRLRFSQEKNSRMDRAPGWRCYPKAGGGEQGDPSACTLPQPGFTRLLILPSLAKNQGKSLSDTYYPLPQQ